MCKGNTNGGATAVELSELDKPHGILGQFHGFRVSGGKELIKCLKVWFAKEVRKRAITLGFDEEPTRVVAVDGGGVKEAASEGVEAGEGIGYGFLEELGFA